MTVKQLLDVMPSNQKVHILNACNCFITLDRYDPVMLSAFESFVISKVEAADENEIEVALKLVPMKEN